VALWLWHGQSAPARQGPREPFLAGMRAGLTHAAGNQALRNTLWRSVLFFFFGSAYWALLPLVAHEQLQGGASLFGRLVGCVGLGAVAGALILPRWRASLGLDHIVTLGTIGTALALAGFALLRAPVLGMGAALLAGASWIASLSSLNVAAQLAVPDWVRARGMALYTSVFYGCLALGSVFWGQVATHVGLTLTLLLAAAGAITALAMAATLPLQPAR
jgi:predicted MFS family arabinose efflux permease